MSWIELTTLDGKPICVNIDRFDALSWSNTKGGHTEIRRLTDRDPPTILTVREHPEMIIWLATHREPPVLNTSELRSLMS